MHHRGAVDCSLTASSGHRMHHIPRQALIAGIGLTLTTLFWAGNAVLARGVVGEIPPVALAFWRWVLAFALLLPFGLRFVYRARAEIRRHWAVLVCLSLLSVATFNTLLYLAAQTTTAINITLVNSAMPVGVAVMAWLLLRQRTTVAQTAGIFAAAAGTAVIVTRGDWQVLLELAIHRGDLLMVAAILIWGVYSVLLRRWPVPIHPVGFLTITVGTGTLLLLPVYLLEHALVGGFAFRSTHVPVFLYVAIFPGILAYLFWNHGVSVLGPARSSMFVYLMPLFAAVLANLLLAETLHVYHAVGGFLILCGLLLSTRSSA
jgi:drug/metabolite transporter (DMT)-like permease